jgi:hypothetical protein
MQLEKDDFDAWRSDPVTVEVMRVVQRLADRAKEKWLEISWAGGSADPVMLADLRARAEIATDLFEMTFEDYTEKTDDEKPERHSPDRIQSADSAS